MRYAVISDIHGNYPALKAVLDDINRRGVDRLLFLGDYYHDLPFPNQIADIIKGLDNAYVVKGNKEDYIISVNLDKSTWIYNQMNSLYWNLNELTPENLEYYPTLPEEIQLTGDSGEYIRMFHSAARVFNDTSVLRMGSGRYYFKMKDKPFTHSEYLTYVNDTLSADDKFHLLLGGLPDGAYLFGHTHIQWHCRIAGKLLLNPGSCGMPLDFDTRPAYSIIEYKSGYGWHVEEIRVDYDRDGVISALKASELYKSATIMCDVFIEHLTSGEERLSFLLDAAEKIANEMDDPGRPYSNKIWRMAGEMYRNQTF